jgi:hypothetical protein
MEIERVAEDIRFINQIGQTLAIDERYPLNPMEGSNLT